MHFASWNHAGDAKKVLAWFRLNRNCHSIGEGNTNKEIMNKALGIALVVVGVVLIVYGIHASNSVSSDVSRTFTGAPTNRTLWLLLGGAGAATVGALLAFTGAGRAQK